MQEGMIFLFLATHYLLFTTHMNVTTFCQENGGKEESDVFNV